MNTGYLYALLAFGLWGLTPIYFKYLSHTPPVEMVANRVLWSVILLLILITGMAKWYRVRLLISQPKHLFTLLLTTVLIATNWLVFIWAINDGRMLETSLGYYINPLITVFLGYIFLQEKHSRVKWFAVFLAAIGVALQLFIVGYLPWVSLVLAFSFGFYGLLHKRTPTDSLTSLFLETSLLLPFAMGYLLWLSYQGEGPATRGTSDWLFLILAGPITTAPLLFFSGAAKRLPLSVIGFFQYLSPSMLFVLAIFVYGEPFDPYKLITFIFIWIALAIFSWDSLRRR
ncbi:EamA family transporter RarD [Marinomonas sp.]